MRAFGLLNNKKVISKSAGPFFIPNLQWKMHNEPKPVSPGNEMSKKSAVSGVDKSV